MVKSFRQKRRAGEISTEVNVTYFSKAQTETEEVHANCDEGRVTTPTHHRRKRRTQTPSQTLRKNRLRRMDMGRPR